MFESNQNINLSHQTQGALVEFSTLREEIMRRSTSQQLLVHLAFITSGTLFTLGIKIGIKAPQQGFHIFLLIPLLLLLLAIGWSDHDKMIVLIGEYIQHKIEPHFSGLGWEKFCQKHYFREPGWKSNLHFLHVRGIFLLLNLFAVVFAYRCSFSTSYRDVVLILGLVLFDGYAVIQTCILVDPSRWRKKIEPVVEGEELEIPKVKEKSSLWVRMKKLLFFIISWIKKRIKN